MSYEDETSIFKAITEMGFIATKELVFALGDIMEYDGNWDPFDYKEWIKEYTKCS